jgi:outer membrane lipoprotein-sorting protein
LLQARRFFNFNPLKTMIFNRHIPFLLCAVSGIFFPAHAQEAPAVPLPLHSSTAEAEFIQAAVQNGQLSPAQRATVEKTNAWFNATLVLSAQFTQTAPDGTQTQGQVFMAKPGRVRFQYAKPSPLEIIADGASVAVRDRSLNTQDIYPLSQTPLRLLLQPNLDLARDTALVSVNEQNGMISIVIEDNNAVSGKSRLSIVLGGEPLALRQWTITDAQGLDTSITLTDPNTTTKPENRLFQIDYTRDVANGSNR